MKWNPFPKTFFALTLALMLASISVLAIAAEIVTSVDRNPVNKDESFKIFFTAAEAPDSDPDFTPLENDFTVLNQSQSSSASLINGTYSKTIRWAVEVIPKKSGNVVIPAIIFGDDTSKPHEITVNETASNNTDESKADADIFLEVKATPEQPYVQSQVIYTLRVYRRVNVAQAEMSEPTLEDAVIEKLGEDSNFNSLVNGVSYLVTERKYAIFPQKSGELRINPLALTAEVIVDGQPDFRDFFGSRMTKTKRVMSKEVVLDVKPKPISFNGKDWLAAEKLVLTQEWSGDIQALKVGEPITRTLTLRGNGTTVGQLPELSATKTDSNLKVYPDQPVLNEQKQPDGISASRQEKIALIPATAGKHVLSAIEIPWFNTHTHSVEVAKIPAVTLNVVGGVENQSAVQPSSKTSDPVAPALTPELNKQHPIAIQLEAQNYWPWVSLCLAFGWLATVILFLLKKPKNQIAKAKLNREVKHETEVKECIKMLKNACDKSDIQAAKTALLNWGKLKFKANNLGEISRFCDAPLKDEITQLNQSLYGRDATSWNGKKLMQAFMAYDKSRAVHSRKEQEILEPLHRL